METRTTDMRRTMAAAAGQAAADRLRELSFLGAEDAEWVDEVTEQAIRYTRLAAHAARSV